MEDQPYRDLSQRLQDVEEENRALRTQLDEQMCTVRALAASEAKYRDLFDSMEEGFCVIEVLFDVHEKPIDYRFLEINAAFEKQTGLHDAVGKRMRELAPAHEEHWFQIYGKIALTGVPQRFENPAMALHRWYDVYAYRIGQPEERHVAIIFNDITERKRTEEALRKSEERLRIILRTLPVGVLITDSSGQVIESNDVVEQIYGGSVALTQSPQEYRVGKAWWTESGHPVQTGEWPSDIALQTGETVLNREIDIERADGTRGTMLDSAAPLRDAGEKIIGAVVVIQDITDRKQSEEALRESQERFIAMANNISQLAWMADETGWIFWYNKRWYEYTGTTPEQMEGWGWQRVHDPNVLPQVLEEWQKSIATGEPFDMEFPLRGADGRFRPFLTRVFPVKDAEGRITYWFGTNTDISEIRRTQDELLKLNETLEQRVRDRTAALEAANKELEAFSYSVSHDLRAPLRGIDGFTKILAEQYPDLLDERGRDYLARVRAAAQRMNRLIDDMLKLSRIGRAEMRWMDVDLSALAASVVEELRQRDPERKVEVEIQPGLLAQGDAGLLRIVLENLLGNAWKFTGLREDARIEVGMTTRDHERIYFVRDNGVGFNMAYADKLFTPFQRLHTEEEFPGTGIGLAIVQRIIMRHGGRVWAESEEGKGTTIYFTLGEGTPND